MRPIYILNNVPGAPEGSPQWTDICHKPRFFVIMHDEFRSTSRWNHVDRKRQFVVRDSKYLQPYASSKTLSGALKAARRLQKELE